MSFFNLRNIFSRKQCFSGSQTSQLARHPLYSWKLVENAVLSQHLELEPNYPMKVLPRIVVRGISRIRRSSEAGEVRKNTHGHLCFWKALCHTQNFASSSVWVNSILVPSQSSLPSCEFLNGQWEEEQARGHFGFPCSGAEDSRAGAPGEIVWPGRAWSPTRAGEPQVRAELSAGHGFSPQESLEVTWEVCWEWVVHAGRSSRQLSREAWVQRALACWLQMLSGFQEAQIRLH